MNFVDYIKEDDKYRDYYRKMKGLKKPTTTYAFTMSGSDRYLFQKGNLITQNAYSPAQAIRFLKRKDASYMYEDIEAVEYAPTNIISPVIPKEKETTEIIRPDQLSLNINEKVSPEKYYHASPLNNLNKIGISPKADPHVSREPQNYVYLGTIEYMDEYLSYATEGEYNIYEVDTTGISLDENLPAGQEIYFDGYI